MKHRQQIADMDTICEVIRTDWSTGVVARMLADNGSSKDDSLKSLVHSSLGSLIKQRKVYYTGNKGYFLVVNKSDCQQQLLSSSASMASVVSNVVMDRANQTPAAATMPIGNRPAFGALGSQLRHSLRSRSASLGKNRNRLVLLIIFERQFF